MLRKKLITFSVTMALTVSLLVGCTDGNQKTTLEDTTKIVQVTKVDGTTITADVGELTSAQKDRPGGTPPDGMPSGGADGGTPPDGADGKAPDGGVPPEKKESGNFSGSDKNVPSGDLKENGEPPSGKPGGSRFTANGESITFTITDSTQIIQEFQQGSEEAAVEDIVKNSVLEITFDSENQPVKVMIKNLQAGKGFGGSDEVTNGTSANTITEEKIVNGENYTSDGDDENALRVDGTDATLKNITVKKNKGNSSNTENGDFYGQNAGLLVLNGSTTTIEGGTFQTNAVNGNAVFSYGEGTTVNISDATIRTTQNNSGGIQTTGGATMNAANLDVQTEGNSAAAIRSDRGGGTVKVVKEKYVTDGTGGEVEVTLDNDSTWTLTGDSYITGFHGDTSNINTNGYHLYVKDEQIK